MALLVEKYGPNFISEFTIVSQQLAEVLQRAGLNVQPFKNPAVPHFAALNAEKQKEVIFLTKIYLEVCQAVEAEGVSIRDSRALTWRMIRKMNYTPQHDIFEKMLEDDVVEIYDPTNVQLFRNIRFFEVCTYSLEELLCVEWWKLYNRDSAMTQKVFQACARVVSGEITETFDPEIEPHLLEEIASSECLRMKYQMKYVSPLKRDGKIAGFLCIERCDLLPKH